VAWGDYDNNGALDILLAGWSTSGHVTRVYRNDGGSFSDANAGLPGFSHGDVAWGDYDNDGDLDILLAGAQITRIYRNNSATANTVPGAPSTPYSTVNGNVVTLDWTAANDAQTPSSGLTYNLVVTPSVACRSLSRPWPTPPPAIAACRPWATPSMA